MEEINLIDLFNYYKSKIVYIIVITILVIGCGVLYKTFIEAPKYESTTTLILTGFTKNDKDTSIDNDEITINQKLVSTYQEIARSDRVLLQVIDKLDLNCTVENLANRVSVSAVSDTEIIRITVHDTDAKRAYKTVSKIAEIFSKEVKEIYNISNVSILDTARTPKVKSNMSLAKSTMIFTLVGIVLGVGLITVIFYFDTTIKTTDELETKFDIPILGSIQMVEDDNAKKKRGKFKWMN
ncbi:MAG: YveK family protein [Candidatus Coprovivens sp.]